ncbi:MAG: hypothetical protein KZQ88_07510 [Candidatus Thiodiazotropha sp. (ex Dulcina madagascariensis)]|nr:hypothetical protein [Candidatus Thiodiazotropha sp. (ex Dulcina madagascariensis)]MCU7925842.1 hypothetical protein [Candidatus Thiodiazotropha sp. (ex Dulcina madagascariensis)]
MNNKKIERRLKALVNIRKQKEWGLHFALQRSAKADKVHEAKKNEHIEAEINLTQCWDNIRKKYNQEDTYIDLNELENIKQNLVRKKYDVMQLKQEKDKAENDAKIVKNSVINIKKSIRIIEKKEHNQKKISIKNMIKDSWKEMDEIWLLKVFK